MNIKSKPALAAVMIAIVTTGTAVYAVLPGTTVSPSSVPLGTLAGASPVNVLSVDAFTRAINQDHGSNAVLQHITLAASQSTGWHTHPGPNIVLVVGGSVQIIDEHCDVTNYSVGQSFATGLDVHQAVAGLQGTDVYTFDLLPEDAAVLRTDASPPLCATH
jgi:quercetin dioxygenase-like cupin family protein